ncbi:MAG TPA: methyltransferase [Gemmatimonadaceae bacterium]|nr:methyltransferase [Gemmatimonadaceae bacterium]
MDDKIGAGLDFRAVASNLIHAGIPTLVLRAPNGPPNAPYAIPGYKTQLAIRPDDVSRAVPLIAQLGWRYSWVRSGLMRIVPMEYYWWDGGQHLELFWGCSAAPFPAGTLSALNAELWRRAHSAPEGFLVPDTASLAVHLAVQSCRQGRNRRSDWQHFLKVRERISDWTEARAIAKRAGVSRALSRALGAAECGADAPGAGPVFDGVLELAWEAATAVQRRVRPSRLRHILDGSPALGEAAIRCRVGTVEVHADPGVFVPTPDAELFVRAAREHLGNAPSPTIVEVGTGCGAIALALAAAYPGAEVHATELAPAGVRSARQNAARLGLQHATFHQGSLLNPVPRSLVRCVDVVLANLPFYPADGYAPIGAVPRATIQGGGHDGLELVRQLIRDARPLLRARGRLFLQMFATQWSSFRSELAQHGYAPGTPREVGPFVIAPADFLGHGQHTATQ